MIDRVEGVARRQRRRIEDLRGPPKIGVVYDVPTLNGLPIIPTPHKDEGLDRLHVHYDMRFIEDWQKDQIGCLPHDILTGIVQRKHNWVQTSSFDPCNSSICRSGAVLLVGGTSSFGRRTLRCVRKLKAPMIPLSGVGSRAVRPICKNGRLLCPHRGADVTHLRPNKQGHARCPLHGQLLDLYKAVTE